MSHTCSSKTQFDGNVSILCNESLVKLTEKMFFISGIIPAVVQLQTSNIRLFDSVFVFKFCVVF